MLSVGIYAFLAMAAAAMPVAVDVDGSIADLVALAALLNAPGVNVRLVTINGNTAATLAAAATNTRNFIDMMGRSDIIVARGAATSWSAKQPCRDGPLEVFPKDPPAQTPFNRWDHDTCYGLADDLASPDNVATRMPTATAALTLALRGYPEPLQYIALGSLTNLADFLRAEGQEGGLAQHLGAVHILGGRIGTGTPIVNVGASAEWNFFVDPAAADYVLSFPGLHRLMYPLDLTSSIRFDADRWNSLTDNAAADRAADSRLVSWLSRALRRVEDSARNSGLALFDIFAPSELFVVVTLASPRVHQTLSQEPHSFELRVNASGVVIVVADDGMTAVAQSHLNTTSVYTQLDSTQDEGSHSLFWATTFEWLNIR